MSSYMENFLGVSFDREAKIPGSFEEEGILVLYFSVDASDDVESLFGSLIEKVDPPLVKDGGAVLAGCKIETPSGVQFHAISCHGDLEGWRLQIEQGSKKLGLILTRVCGDSIKLPSGDEIALATCNVNFY